jgi:hypothetical protein
VFCRAVYIARIGSHSSVQEKERRGPGGRIFTVRKINIHMWSAHGGLRKLEKRSFALADRLQRRLDDRVGTEGAREMDMHTLEVRKRTIFRISVGSRGRSCEQRYSARREGANT